MKINFYKAHGLTILWALLILILTLTPGKFIPKVDYWAFFSLDKYVHISIFFIQVFLILWNARTLRVIDKKIYFISILIGVSYGALIEVIQLFIPQRSFEWNDLLANTFGVFLACVLFYLLEKLNFLKTINNY
ncbi:MAG: VanZ family protein [Cytophagales bacterium]|nr:MAG: VanZ family protein [Cytophagales bacterium]